MIADLLDAAARGVNDVSARAAAAVCDAHERVNRATAQVRQVAAFIRDPWWAPLPDKTPSAPGPVAPPAGPGAGREVAHDCPGDFGCPSCAGLSTVELELRLRREHERAHAAPSRS